MRALVILLLIAAAALAGWLYFHGSFDSYRQKTGEAFIRVGDFRAAHLPSANYAGHYLPYALFALRAYDPAGPGGSPKLNALLERPAPDDPARSRITAELRGGWLGDWALIEQGEGPLPCPDGDGQCGGRALGGLGYKVFSSQARNEIVVAFRGTDFKEAHDWIANLRWVTRFLPYYDQYAQVQRHIGPILDRALAAHKLADPTIVATGHSLGGGLAQQAAYKDGRIRAVYAFDPSTVTGYYDPGVPGKENSVGLLIDRVYQRGEVLAYLRFLMTQLYPVAAFNPQIRTVRFSFGAEGGVVARHNMADLAAGLLETSGTPEAWAARALPLPNAPGSDPGETWIYRLVDWINRK
ncbi:hypothetical protein RPB_2344 [Rhodopseudomonas palustris HaA2]|uniref:Uncharacterized protein n=1 Tax=Rhodopseudomonas palustris (strain HaA2) TaxID=316058 RepID=Q2IXL1_RHOP2|nr:lipase [Rhodopseudomonas palustris]ABD07049.1 hypothetical protein RPB_2344 [Rhodopseudomonas palustris HaA2]